MTAPNLIIPSRRLVIPRMTIRPRLAPKPIARARLEAQHVHFQLINPDGKVAQEGEAHNLILSQTGDLLAQYSFQDLVAYAIVSTDSTTPDASDTSIPSEVARTNTAVGSDTLTRTSDGVYVYTVTREFSASQVGNQNLVKWGFSPTSDGSPISEGLFGETITSDGTQKLRLIYAIKITLSPVTATDFTAFDITDWVGTTPVTGQMGLKRTQDAGGGYTTAQGDLDIFTAMTAATGVERLASLTAAAGLTNELNLTYDSNTNGATAARGTVTLGDYVAGSNQRTASVIFSTGQANDKITSLMCGASFNVQYLGAHYWDCCLGFDWDSECWGTKDDLHTLELDGFGWSWTVG